MDDKDKRELVDELVGIARLFHASSQLRDRIRNAVLPALEKAQSAANPSKSMIKRVITLSRPEIDWGEVDDELLAILKRHADQPIRHLDPVVSDLRVLLRKVGDPL